MSTEAKGLTEVQVACTRYACKKAKKVDFLGKNINNILSQQVFITGEIVLVTVQRLTEKFLLD